MLLPKDISNNFTENVFSLIYMINKFRSANSYSYATRYVYVKSSKHDKLR